MKVYVTQESQLDYTPALKYGDIVFLTSPGDRLSAIPTSLGNEEIIWKIEKRLSEFTEDDYLLCTGAPAHMAIAGSILGKRLKKLLVWDGRAMSYFPLRIKA